MKLLFFGDVVGRSGREAVCLHLPRLKAEENADAAIVNVDNAAGGFGVTPAICEELFRAGADVLTAGNHIWDQAEVIPYLAREKRLLRPANFPAIAPGSGLCAVTLAGGRQLIVLHLQGQVFMQEALACPFAQADEALSRHRLGGGASIFVDFHAETTSEKAALGLYLDGRVSAVIGTHTHIPTADARLLPGGTAYQTDAGMCGDYHSVIGMEKAAPLRRFTTKIARGNKMVAANGEAAACGVVVTIDDKTGLATGIRSFRIGGVFSKENVSS
jgi:metallophosphoesterase (TIGR00282 family)